MDKPLVIVTLLNYENAPDTAECIDSLLACRYPRMEILVLDNCSRDDSLTMLHSRYPSVQLHEAEKNLGYTGGVNRTIELARKRNPDYILVLNNDTVVEPSFMDPLVEEMEQRPRVACACGTIYAYHDRNVIWYGGGHLVGWRGLAVHENKGLSIKPSALGGTRPVTFVTGCMLLLRTSMLDEIGLEDERFFIYLDDMEISARILHKGYELIYVPRSVIFHKVYGEKENPWKLYLSVRNRLLLIGTAFRGLDGIIAYPYFLGVITAKLFLWFFTNRVFFRAGLAGLVDYYRGNYYEGRDRSYFTSPGGK